MTEADRRPARFGLVWTLAVKSLASRRLTALLTVVSVAVSVALIVAVDGVRTETKASFTRTISGADLIVGARGGPLNLLLYSVFRIGDATSGMRWESFEALTARPEVAWAIPLSLGDAHRGFRVLGTTTDYFVHYRYGRRQPLEFAAGEPFADAEGAVLGAEVAAALGYGLGDAIVVSHGIGAASFTHHDDAPFQVVGILARTGTPVDATVHITLGGVERMHATDAGAEHSHDDHADDAPGSPSEEDDKQPEQSHAEDADDHAAHADAHADDHADDHTDHGDDHADEPAVDHADHADDADEPADDHADHAADHADDHANHAGEDAAGAPNDPEDARDEHAHDEAGGAAADVHAGDEPADITACIIGLKSPQLVFRVQRFVNDYRDEPLLAIVPGVALQQLWAVVGVVETALLATSLLVIAAGLVGMLTMLLTGLGQRRREMAVLRAVGAGRGAVFGLIVAEAVLLATAAAALGVLLAHAGLFVVRDVVAARFGLALAVGWPGGFELAVVAGMALAAGFAATLPAWRLLRMSLADGLTMRLAS